MAGCCCATDNAGRDQATRASRRCRIGRVGAHRVGLRFAAGAAPAVDPLKAQLTLARHDSELAAAAATTESPRVAAALKQVASERAQHATALSAEIDRVAGITSSTPSSTTTTTSAAPGPPPALSDVVGALRTSAGSAGQLAITESGYRAGLMGSIAAACTAAYTVGLVFGDSAS